MSKIYAFGGVESVTGEVYQPDGKDARIVFPLSNPARMGHTAVALDGRIYLLGGRNAKDNKQTLSSVACFDPRALRWITLEDLDINQRLVPSLSIERAGLAAVECGGAIYALGGHNGQYLDIVEKFHPQHVCIFYFI
jgi:N-acetylneuraminic acid mutarotase